MDYKKRYNEALERCKKVYLDCTDEERKVADYIFPEFRESEDERIRKIISLALIASEDELSDFYKVHNIHRKECTDWLEKQKENIEKEYVFRPLAGTDIHSAALQAIRRADEGDRLVLAFNEVYIPVRKGCNANKIVDIYNAFIEKQKDQESSTEETELNSIAFLEQMGYTCIPPGSKQEWSEEDRKDIADFLYGLNVGFTQAAAKDRAKDILSIIRPQPKQEWSEEEAKKAAEDYANEFPGMTHENDGSTIEDYDKPYNDFLAGVLWAREAFDRLNKQNIQKEQKPADSVSKEEYVKRFKALCDAYEIKLPNREHDIYHLCDDLSKLSIDSGKHESAEGDKEDETHRAFILESLEDQIRFCKKDAEGAYYAKQIRTAQNWLKSLPLDLKKRNEDVTKLCSNEWSEEDEEHIKSLLARLEGMCKKGATFTQTRFAVSQDRDWLKSLRPHLSDEEIKKIRSEEYTKGFNDAAFGGKAWKPSEDEVRLINTSICFLKDFADMGYENAVECIDWLKSKLNGNKRKNI